MLIYSLMLQNVNFFSLCQQFSDPKDARDDETFEATLFWEYAILPAAAAQPVPAANADTTDGLDSHLPRVDVSTPCNCGRCVRNPLCLVSFATHQAVHESASVLSEDDEDFFPSDKDESDEAETDEGAEGEDEGAVEAEEDEEDEVVTYSENFRVVGTAFEQRYQQAMAICCFLKSEKKEPHIRARHEPDNIKDSNAICFEVNHLEKWFIMGYCSLKKLPKLFKALKRREILKITLSELKRTYIPMEKKNKLFARVSILKSGKWDKDDDKNIYNSQIDI